MSTEKIACNSCGAPLEVATTTQFATCRHCGSKLSIKRTDTATFTEILEQLTAKTEQLSERINQLSGHSELAALDREWELERQKYLVSDKHGHTHIPSQAGSIGGGIAITLFGCFWTMMAFAITSSAPPFGPFAIIRVVFPLFGVVFVIGGIASSISAFNKADKYQKAERRYRRLRGELQNRDR